VREREDANVHENVLTAIASNARPRSHQLLRRLALVRLHTAESATILDQWSWLEGTDTRSYSFCATPAVELKLGGNLRNLFGVAAKVAGIPHDGQV